MQIGPRGRYQRACAIGEDEHELQLSARLHAPEDFQRPPFKRVAAPDDHHTFGIAIGSAEVLPSPYDRSG